MTGRLRLAARSLVRGEPKTLHIDLTPTSRPGELPAVSLVCSFPTGNAGGSRYVAFHSPSSAVDSVFVVATEPIESVLSALSARWPGRPLEIRVPWKKE